MTTTPLGHTTWVFPGGDIPAESTGREPEFTSRDTLCVLNTGRAPAGLEITAYFAGADPVGPFLIEVGGQRVRHVPVNNLIDPQALPLGEPYGLVVRSDVAIVAQLSRTDTRRGALAIAVAPGHPLTESPRFDS